MQKVFYVYTKAGKKSPIVSASPLPDKVVVTKRAFVGGKAKMEALFRLYGYYPIDPQENVKADINLWINNNLYKTEKWRDYKALLAQVEAEQKTVEEQNILQYKMLCEYNSENNPSDEVLVYFIMNELMGTPQQFYNGIADPIISLKKVW